MQRYRSLALIALALALLGWAASAPFLEGYRKELIARFLAADAPQPQISPAAVRSAKVTAMPGQPATAASEPILRIETGFHAGIVNKIALTRQGQMLTVSDDKTARLWQSPLKPARPFRVPIGLHNEGALYAVAASPIKDIAVVGGSTGLSWDKAASVYSIDLNSGEIIGRLSGIPGSIHALSYSGDGRLLAIGTSTGLLRMVDLAAKSLTTQNNDCRDTLSAIEFLPDRQFLTACFDGKIRLYDEHYQIIAAYTLENRQRPWRIAVAPDMKQLAVGTLDSDHIILLSTRDLSLIKPLAPSEKQDGGFSAVAWMGHRLFAAGTYCDSAGPCFIHVWDLKTGKQSDIAAAQDSITDLLPASDTELVFTTAEALVGKVNVNTGEIQAHSRLIADFRDAYSGQFTLSRDGTIIEIGQRQGGEQPLRFSFSERNLSQPASVEAGLFPPFIPRAAGNWRNSPHPAVHGKPIRLDNNELSRSVAATPDETLLLLGCDYSLRLFKADGTAVWTIPLAAPALAVNLSRDLRYAVAALGDGTLHWFNLADASEAMALFITADMRWIAWTPEGYFDQSHAQPFMQPAQPAKRGLRPVFTTGSTAAKLIGYHINRGHTSTPDFISADQLQQNFFRPDLVSQQFYQSTASAGKITGNVKTVLNQHAPPLLQALSWCEQDRCKDIDLAGSPARRIKVRSSEIKLRYQFAGQGSGIGDVIIKRHGAAVATRGLRVSGPKAENYADEQNILLEPGDNPITLSAFDAEKTLESEQKIDLVFQYDATPIKPSLYTLSIGINHYQTEGINALVNAVNDANGINALLGAQHGRFAKIISATLTESAATRQTIENTLQSMAAKAGANDVVVIYFAGHGVVIDRNYYFLPYDIKNAERAEIQANALSDSRLATLLSSFATPRVTLLIDSCYAGSLATSAIFTQGTQDATWTGSLGQRTGRFVLAASATDEEALDGIDGHGVFTSVILKALNGGADKELLGNKDGRVNVVELLQYTEQHVPQEAKKIDPSHRQKATGFFMGSDFFELADVKS